METIKRFERLMRESAKADLEVAKALSGVQTLLASATSSNFDVVKALAAIQNSLVIHGWDKPDVSKEDN